MAQYLRCLVHIFGLAIVFLSLGAWGIVLRRVSATDMHFASLFRGRGAVSKHKRVATLNAASFWSSVAVFVLRLYTNGILASCSLIQERCLSLYSICACSWYQVEDIEEIRQEYDVKCK
ncbi:uncharacterized protein BKA55DRAFT_244192 [Fusarium redolens]|uniref:Uncharacterized protein n=1 Tax=Fusarium redolens TaxID=48865 RepID=A0A9P9HWJ8_FUSRE|nr:uncharacterized protein BKA55DRAFT_244192 [Fusarium redolens]KAH7265278.1 hypothetical protein BKA55DRAFT_244192 [Fusarium redolens]